MLAKTLLVYALLYIYIQRYGAQKSSNPPKIVTKDGSIIIKAGENGDIVFEPAEGHQVRIGSNVLNVSSTQGSKGEKGDQGEQGPAGAKGESGLHGAAGRDGGKGERGPPGDAVSVNGSKGDTGAKGENGTQGPVGPKGEQGPSGPSGPKGSMATALNPDARCVNSSDSGLLRFKDGYLQVCTKAGWSRLAYRDNICENVNVPRNNLEAFKQSNFSVLFQFNGGLNVNLGPSTSANITAAFQDGASSSSSAPQFLPSAMGKALHLTGRQHINLGGLPQDFWIRNEWSVMALVKLGESGLNSNKEVAVIGSGTPSANKGFHLGIKNKEGLSRNISGQRIKETLFSHRIPLDSSFSCNVHHLLYGFYSNDLEGKTLLNYDQWYQLTWTWKKTSTNQGTRNLYVNGVEDKSVENQNIYRGTTDNTEIGAWWDDTTNRNNNLQIDTLFIIDKMVEYTNNKSEPIQLCLARSMNHEMP